MDEKEAEARPLMGTIFLVILDEEDLDEITWRGPTFSPILTNEDNTSVHEYLCSIDPECGHIDYKKT